MSSPERKLTANLTSAGAGNLLDVNERLHALAPRLKERRPEDIEKALALVTEYGELISDAEREEERIVKEFERLQKLLPEARLRRIDLVVGGKTMEALITEMQNNNIVVTKEAKEILMGDQCVVSTHPQKVTLVKIMVEDLQLESSTTEAILTKAVSLGLGICSPEIAPYYRLKYTDQSQIEVVCLGMKEVAVSGFRGCGLLCLSAETNSRKLSVEGGKKPKPVRWVQEIDFVFSLKV